MAVAFFYEDDLNPERADRKLLYFGTYNDFEIRDEEKIIRLRPKLNDSTLGEYYPEVFMCIDGKDYLVANGKVLKKFGDSDD